MAFDDLPTAFTRSQSLAADVSDYQLRRLLHVGTIDRPRRGVFVKRHEDVPERRAERAFELARAALSGYKSDLALSHLVGAAAYRLPLPLAGVSTIDLTDLSGSRKSRRSRGIQIHTADSYQIGVSEVDGLLVTSPARTVADCLREYGPRVSVPIADAALHRQLVTAQELQDELAMQCHWPGRHRVDSACLIVDGRRESWLESYAAVRFDEWGMDQPTPQVEIRDEAGWFVARVDGGWLEDGTVLELDGRSKYQLGAEPRTVWELEKQRYDRLGNLGLERVRFGLKDLLERETSVRRQIHERRRRGSRARFSGEFRVPSSSDLTLS